MAEMADSADDDDVAAALRPWLVSVNFATTKDPFIATQLNSTQLDVELS